MNVEELEDVEEILSQVKIFKLLFNGFLYIIFLYYY